MKIVHCVTRGRSVCFYGEGNVFRTSSENTSLTVEMISPESHRILFLTSPMISVFFSYPWVGSAIMFFEAAERRENTDLQVVALIYTYCERN